MKVSIVCKRESNQCRHLISRYPHRLVLSQEKARADLAVQAELGFSFRCGCLQVCGDGMRCEALLQLPLTGCFCVQIGVLSGQQASLRSLRHLTFNVLMHVLLYDF